MPDAGTISVAAAQNIRLLAALSGITIIFVPDKEPKFRTVLLNTDIWLPYKQGRGVKRAQTKDVGVPRVGYKPECKQI